MLQLCVIAAHLVPPIAQAQVCRCMHQGCMLQVSVLHPSAGHPRARLIACKERSTVCGCTGNWHSDGMMAVHLGSNASTRRTASLLTARPPSPSGRGGKTFCATSSGCWWSMQRCCSRRCVAREVQHLSSCSWSCRGATLLSPA
jgi:hypothetical protein